VVALVIFLVGTLLAAVWPLFSRKTLLEWFTDHGVVLGITSPVQLVAIVILILHRSNGLRFNRGFGNRYFDAILPTRWGHTRLSLDRCRLDVVELREVLRKIRVAL
jgi:hypothetical protein